MYVTGIEEKQIFKRDPGVCNSASLRAFRTNRSSVACSFGNALAASQNARSNGQTSNHRHCEFVADALKKCVTVATWILLHDLLFFESCHIHLTSIQTHYVVCMFYCIGVYSKHSVCRYINWKLTTFNIYTHLNFSIL